MDPVPASYPAHVPIRDKFGKAAFIISILTFIFMALGLWQMNERIDHLFNERVIRPTLPMAPTPSAPVVADVPPAPIAPQTAWNVVKTLVVATKKGAIQIRHDCDIQPDAVSFNGATYKGTVCFGTSRLVLVDLAGHDHIIVTRPLPSADSEARSVAPLLLSATTQDFTNGKQDVLITFDANECSSVGDCGVGQPTPRITYVYSVDQDKTSTIQPIGDRASVIWGGDRKAVVLTQTCFGADCDDPAELQGFDLNTNTVKPISSLKAQWANGQPALDSSGKPLAYWQSVQWLDDTHAEAVYVGTDGNRQTVPLATF